MKKFGKLVLINGAFIPVLSTVMAASCNSTDTKAKNIVNLQLIAGIDQYNQLLTNIKNNFTYNESEFGNKTYSPYANSQNKQKLLSIPQQLSMFLTQEEVYGERILGSNQETNFNLLEKLNEFNSGEFKHYFANQNLIKKNGLIIGVLDELNVVAVDLIAQLFTNSVNLKKFLNPNSSAFSYLLSAKETVEKGNLLESSKWMEKFQHDFEFISNSLANLAPSLWAEHHHEEHENGNGEHEHNHSHASANMMFMFAQVFAKLKENLNEALNQLTTVKNLATSDLANDSENTQLSLFISNLDKVINKVRSLNDDSQISAASLKKFALDIKNSVNEIKTKMINIANLIPLVNVESILTNPALANGHEAN
ncbi:MAG5150 family histidine triad lipoprotein [Mycoplasmopsis iners]|uniref:MAG5150 family histidine triad lipoprotein n=1 Tax=Mycoplasmopsis iners TaxID=76630 RepID=UPI000495F057|nr:hypothetical protein [Mycoplasmopsis iners]